MTFRTRARRHLTVTLLGTAVLASITGLATPAAAQAQPRPVPDTPNRVVANADELLQPRASAAGSPLRFETRIGRGNDTPDDQTWSQRRGRGGGTISLVHTPSTTEGGLQLCVDVEGDSVAAGARLVLRPCDGTDSQLWRRLGGGSGPRVLQNVQSGLNMERVPGGVVQNDFAPDDRERSNNQLFSVSPKSFGLGE